MRIYIDESGIFANPNQTTMSVSCVGGVVIPERAISRVFNRYRRLLFSWGKHGTEVKGKDLDEPQVAQVVAMLSKEQLFFVCNLIDMGLHPESLVTQHKGKQADKVVETVNAETHPNLVSQLNELRRRIMAISNPLYVEAQCLISLVPDIIQNAVLYFRNLPKTLGAFSWHLDAKDRNVTEYEDLWASLVCPFLQSHFLRTPLVTVREADYSYFHKYENPPDFPHEHLDPYRTHESGTFESVDLKKIMLEDLSFQNSSANIGLQIADILVTSVRRACRSTLGQDGWENIGSLMLRPLEGPDPIRFLALDAGISAEALPYKAVFNIARKKARAPV